MFCAFTIKAQQNLILNGSFELNSTIQCQTELSFPYDYNNTILYSNHFGNPFTIDIIKDSCLTCLPQTYWGGGRKMENIF